MNIEELLDQMRETRPDLLPKWNPSMLDNSQPVGRGLDMLTQFLQTTQARAKFLRVALVPYLVLTFARLERRALKEHWLFTAAELEMIEKLHPLIQRVVERWKEEAADPDTIGAPLPLEEN